MTGPRSYRNIALCGFMGTGKSSVGRLVADQLRFTFLDTDNVIEARAGKTPYRLLELPRFRAGYDFLCLRAQSGEIDDDIALWWERFQEADGPAREALLVPDSGPKKRRRRRRSNSGGSSGGSSEGSGGGSGGHDKGEPASASGDTPASE